MTARPYDATVGNRVRAWTSETLRNPARSLIAAGLALALAGVPIAFDAALYDDFTLPKQAVLLVAAAVVLAGLALSGDALPRHRLLRVAVVAWAGWLTLALALSIDWRGSILGYYQYRQGYLTQLAYVVLFVGALSLGRSGRDHWLPFAGMAGLAGVAGYTAIQSLGRDPIAWWVDTSDRAIGTIGNANELAAYAVIALAFGAGALTLRGRQRIAVTGGVAAVAVFTLLESESRSGLIALAIAAATFPVAAAFTRYGLSATLREMAVLTAGATLGLLLSLLAGGASGTAGRLQTGAAQLETGNSTRVELWKGTVATIAASPLWGFGPDGLHLAFPRHRPANLHSAFDDYDLVAQSSHNWLLDTAANTGLVGLAALFTLLGTAAWLAFRGGTATNDRTAPYTWSAVAGYGALTLVNPVSLAAHAIFFVLLGILASRAERNLKAPARAKPRLKPVARLALVTPAVAALLAIAVLLPMSDHEANQAWGASARDDFAGAAVAYHDASSLLPFERQYARREAESWLAAGAAPDRLALEHAEAVYERFDGRFGFSAAEAIGLATARIGLHQPASEIIPVVDKALALNPHGVFMEDYTARLRVAATTGAVLRYSARDRWVYVDTTEVAVR